MTWKWEEVIIRREGAYYHVTFKRETHDESGYVVTADHYMRVVSIQEAAALLDSLDDIAHAEAQP